MEPQASQGLLGAEGDCEILSLLLPSPQSEAMTHDMEELSLQPTQSLPPLNERKNGKNVDVLSLYTHTHIFCPALWLILLLTQFSMTQKLGWEHI